MNLRDLKLGYKLALGYALVLLLLIAITLSAIKNMATLNSNTVAIVNVESLKVKLANTALDNVRGSIARVFQLAVATDPRALDEARTRFEANSGAFNQALAGLEPLIHKPEAVALLTKAKDARNQYMLESEKVFAALKEGRRDDATQIAFGPAYAATHSLAEDLRALVVFQEKVFADAGARSEETYRSSRRWMVLFGAIAVLLGALSAWIISAAVSARVRQAAGLSQAVGTFKLLPHHGRAA